MGYIDYGAFSVFNNEGSSISHCYADFSKTLPYTQMVGRNQEGELVECSAYTKINGMDTLSTPVTFNGTATDDLLEALNLWIAEQEHPELYRTWTMAFDTIPVFGDYFVGLPEDGTSASTITVYPNPTKEKVTVKGMKPAEIKVYNVHGQMVKAVRDSNEINVSDLPEGLYLLRISDKAVSTTCRIVVMRP
ncbi:MAG: T9SS type A sorting domain-containing protein [Bacteroidales bacterium]|nr:T9SS type A sorting domain-containing protein [Bacteroidales bacterium]